MIRESASGIINCFKTGSVLIDGSLGLLKVVLLIKVVFQIVTRKPVPVNSASFRCHLNVELLGDG